MIKMDWIHKTAALIGHCFIFAFLIGALVPGMNFHVIFAPDESTINGHKQMAARVEARISKKDGHD